MHARVQGRPRRMCATDHLQARSPYVKQATHCPLCLSQMRLPSLTFASQMHTLSDQEQDKANKAPVGVDAAAIKAAPTLPSSLAALPPRCASSIRRRPRAQ